MKKKRPFIHLFSTPDRRYLFNANKNTIVEIDEQVYNHLKFENMHNEPGQKPDCGGCTSLLERLDHEGFLSESSIQQIIHPLDGVLPYYLDNKLKMLTLQLTQQCNLRCDYCVYSGSYENRIHTGQVMSFEMAKKCIDFLIRRSKDSKSISIGFYGGEPLLEFDLLKKCVEHAEERARGRKVTFNLTSNATLLNEEIVEYFISHDISLVISLDGPKKIHDEGRRFAGNNCSSTFDIIMKKLDMVKEKYPGYLDSISFNAVIDPSKSFSCVNDFFMNYRTFKNLDSNSIIASMISDDYNQRPVVMSEEYSSQWNYEYFKLLLSKVGRLDRKHVSRLIEQNYSELKTTDESLVGRESGPQKCHHGGPCVPGVQRLFVNTDGVFYPCERVDEASENMKIGTVEKGFDIEKVRNLLNVGKLTESQCKECWAISFCHLCAAYADDKTVLSEKRKTANCADVRAAVTERLQNYCTLKELGHDFGENEVNYF